LANWDDWCVILVNGSTVHVMPANLPRLPHVEFTLNEVVTPDKVKPRPPLSHDGRGEVFVFHQVVHLREGMTSMISIQLNILKSKQFTMKEGALPEDSEDSLGVGRISPL
jgi:hypothetical protein